MREFMEPELQLMQFTVEDIITNSDSGGGIGGDGNTGGDGGLYD